jgi:hypothetical protein
MKRAVNRTDSEIKIFFAGRQAALKLFNSLHKTIKKVCSPDIEVTKTQISFGEVYKYFWIWLPQTWIRKRSENSITLTIVTGKKIRSRRIEESIQVKNGYWTHHMIIENSNDIDKEIEGLIREGYEFYLKRLEHKQKKKN